jgi:hypothetical protein
MMGNRFELDGQVRQVYRTILEVLDSVRLASLLDSIVQSCFGVFSS